MTYKKETMISSYKMCLLLSLLKRDAIPDIKLPFYIVEFRRQVVEGQLFFASAVVFFEEREQFVFHCFDYCISKHAEQHMPPCLLLPAMIDGPDADIVAFEVAKGMLHILKAFVLASHRFGGHVPCGHIGAHHVFSAQRAAFFKRFPVELHLKGFVVYRLHGKVFGHSAVPEHKLNPPLVTVYIFECECCFEVFVFLKVQFNVAFLNERVYLRVSKAGDEANVFIRQFGFIFKVVHYLHTAS
jgi:hypothetical protein